MTGPWGAFIFRQPVEDSVAGRHGYRYRALPLHAARPARAGSIASVHALVRVRHEPRLLYRQEFEELARTHPNFRFVPTLSRPEPGWTGCAGHVQEHLFEIIGERRT